MSVYLPVWNSSCTKASFTVLVSCNDEIAVHSCPLLACPHKLRNLRAACCPWEEFVQPSYGFIIYLSYVAYDEERQLDRYFPDFLIFAVQLNHR